MKMFIWEDPYPVRYGMSHLVVVAETLEDARKEALKEDFWSGYLPQIDCGGREARDKIVAQLGEPTRILELPCAVWSEWSE